MAAIVDLKLIGKLALSMKWYDTTLRADCLYMESVCQSRCVSVVQGVISYAVRSATGSGFVGHGSGVRSYVIDVIHIIAQL